MIVELPSSKGSDTAQVWTANGSQLALSQNMRFEVFVRKTTHPAVVKTAERGSTVHLLHHGMQLFEPFKGGVAVYALAAHLLRACFADNLLATVAVFGVDSDEVAIRATC